MPETHTPTRDIVVHQIVITVCIVVMVEQERLLQSELDVSKTNRAAKAFSLAIARAPRKTARNRMIAKPAYLERVV